MPSEPTADACAGIEPPADVAVRTHVFPLDVRDIFECGAGMGDGTGALAFPIQWSHATTVDVVDVRTGEQHTDGSQGMSSTVYPQPRGFFTYGFPYLGTYRLALEAWTPTRSDATARGWFNGDHVAVVRNPVGGVLVAGNLSTEPDEPSAPPLTRQMVMYAGVSSLDGALRRAWGPVALPGTGTVFGAGVDANGRTLIISNGTDSIGEGVIAGQWFDRFGTSLSPQFALIRNFDPSTATWFEAAPLIGGGLLIQGVVPFQDGTPRAYRHNLLVLAGGSTSPQPPAAWLAQRADTRLQILPSGKGYAVLPDGANGVPCTQHLEVLAKDGSSCGERAYPISAGSCDTLDLTLGLDGTVIQQLPTDQEAWATYDGERTGPHGCTWRFWPRAVR